MVAWGLPACVGVAVAYCDFVPFGAGTQIWLMRCCSQRVHLFGMKLVMPVLGYMCGCLVYVSYFLVCVLCVGCLMCTVGGVFFVFEI